MGMEVVIITLVVRLGVNPSSGVYEFEFVRMPASLVFSHGALKSFGVFSDSAPEALWVQGEIPVSVVG
jgi:hypothetical protein